MWTAAIALGGEGWALAIENAKQTQKPSGNLHSYSLIRPVLMKLKLMERCTKMHRIWRNEPKVKMEKFETGVIILLTMKDPRYTQLARTLVGHSMQVARGDKVF